MYADREEALRKSLETGHHQPAHSRSMSAADRERMLQEELRRRVVDSRHRESPQDSPTYGARPEESAYADARRSSRRREDEDQFGRPGPRSDYDHRRRDQRPRDDHSFRRGGWRPPHDDEGASRQRSRSPPASRDARGPAHSTAYEARSVFCAELPARVGQRDLGEFFESYLGPNTVADVRLSIMWPSGESEGYGYVELAKADLVPQALALTGKPMFGAPILVQRIESSRSYSLVQLYDPPRSAVASSRYAPPPPPRSAPTGPVLPPSRGGAMDPSFAPANPEARLLVGNLHFDIGAAHLRAVFEPFGKVDDVEVQYNAATGKSKGTATVQFREASEARQAMEQLDGFELAGRAMRLSRESGRGNNERGHDSVHAASAPRGRHEPQEKTVRPDQGTYAGQLPASANATSAVLLKHMFNPAEYVWSLTHQGDGAELGC